MKKLIEKSEELLKESGFTTQDYTISLQGPTVIFTQTGKEKLPTNLGIIPSLAELGVGLIL
jgi:hypothetical protein